MSDNINLLKSYILYLLTGLLICFVGLSNVFAYTYTNIGDKADITVVLVSTAYGSSPFNVPKNATYNFNEVLQVDYILSNYNFEANKHYQLESHLPNQTFTNANKYIVQGLNGEQCLIDYTSSIFIGSYPRWDFQCPHATNTITLSISNNSNQYLWNNSGIFTWSTALLSYSNESIPVSSDTQDIINNQNQNTQNIIANQNQNTQDIIDSSKVCSNKSILNGSGFGYEVGYLQNDGTIYVVNDFNYTSDYILLQQNENYSITLNYTASSPSYCLYSDNKFLIGCTKYNNNSSLSFNSGNAYFIRYSFRNRSADKTTLIGKICQYGNQAINDTLSDDDTSGATNEASDFFSSFTTNTFGLTSIITAPLSLIQSLTSSSCTQLHLPLPYLTNKYLDLPCMTTIYQQYFGSFFTIYQTITYGIIAYWVIVRIFNQVKDFKNPEHDEIEVVDL